MDTAGYGQACKSSTASTPQCLAIVGRLGTGCSSRAARSFGPVHAYGSVVEHVILPSGRGPAGSGVRA
jgi:hypothetical protein